MYCSLVRPRSRIIASASYGVISIKSNGQKCETEKKKMIREIMYNLDECTCEVQDHYEDPWTTRSRPSYHPCSLWNPLQVCLPSSMPWNTMQFEEVFWPPRTDPVDTSFHTQQEVFLRCHSCAFSKAGWFQALEWTSQNMSSLKEENE